MIKQLKTMSVLLLANVALLCGSASQAQVLGVTGTSFAIETATFSMATPDGDSMLMWGYGVNGGPPQYPGPTLIVDEGVPITITLTNALPNLPATTAPMNVSMLFPGQTGVVASGGFTGVMTQESGGTTPADTVTYTFTPNNPGTYSYYSGTKPGLQVEMGLVGALIVRSGTAGQAYNHADTAYDREYLFVLNDLDPAIHQLVDFGLIDQVDNTVSHAVSWTINGRMAPDTLFPDNVGWMPNQPYGSIAQMHPGEKVLVRVIGGGRDLHPFHLHGNNFDVIARDGRMKQSGALTGPDLAVSDYTLQVQPGATYDAIWTWTGAKLGWDIYGTPTDGAPAHTCTPAVGTDFDVVTHEYCPDHGIALSSKIILPGLQQLTFGGFYGGSPFLGGLGDLPPGEGGLNANGGIFFMWHSHSERELTNNDIYPGGMLTMMIVEPPGVPIP